jgi:ubiquinone/menaquinone biosynthesis C-methylase UbiE
MHSERDSKNQTLYDTVGPFYVASQIWYDQQDDPSRTFISQHLPKDLTGLTLLDGGCGHGADIERYQNWGAEVWGLDESWYMVGEAQTRSLHPDRIIVASLACTLPYEDSFFDCIALRFSLHYVKNLDPTFRELARILKPGGTLIFTVVHPMNDAIHTVDKIYGNQEILSVSLFKGTVLLHYPSHTLTNYLSSTFLGLFSLTACVEYAQITDAETGVKFPAALCLAAQLR